MNRVIISCPFGNYVQPEGATPTFGTYTLYYRGGFLYRLWRCALTLRYSWKMGGWVNRLGLPNPGICSLPTTHSYVDRIISIKGFDSNDWYQLAKQLRYLMPIGAVELNLSCPNVNHDPNVREVATAVGFLMDNGFKIIAKLPPYKWLDWFYDLNQMGVDHFHCCNTIPVPGGGLSGKTLKRYSLWAVEEIKDQLGRNGIVIGGGGITSLQDVKDYISAGADHVALGSMLLNPLNHWRLKEFIQEATALFPATKETAP